MQFLVEGRYIANVVVGKVNLYSRSEAKSASGIDRNRKNAPSNFPQ